MKDAWFIAELQQIILSYCTSSSLSSLARTSKALKNPALNRLWAETPIFRLLDLLPRDSEAVGYRIKRELVPAHIAVFSDYAKRVTHLRLSIAIDPDTIEDLMRHLPKPICPNLRILTSGFDSGDPECNFIIQLLGPHVTTLELNDCDRIQPQSAISLFSYIERCHPFVDVFKTTIDTRSASSSVTYEAICATTTRLISPSHIGIASPNQTVMAHIAASKTIKTFSIHSLTQDAIQPLLTCGPTQFTNLSRLFVTLSPGGIPSIYDLISAILPERLQLFSVVIDYHETSLDQWQMLLQKLAQHHSSTMKTFFAGYSGYRLPCPLDSGIDPLLTMGNLTDIKWRGVMYVPEDNNLRRIAKAWPNLRRLILDARVIWDGLAILARNFPELEELQISLYEGSEPSDHELQETTGTWPHLRKLILEVEQMTSARLANLAKCCPKLEELQIRRVRSRAVEPKLEAMKLTWLHLRDLDLRATITLAGFASLANGCPKLEQARIYLEYGFHTVAQSDRKLEEIISNLPHLCKLKVVPTIPLAVLARLVRSGARLQELEVSLDVRLDSREGLNRVMQDDTGNHSLKRLLIADSSLENATDVANILFKIVPELEAIKLSWVFCNNELDEPILMWSAVCDRLSELRNASGRAGPVTFVRSYPFR